MAREPHDLGVAEAATAIRRGELTAEALTGALLVRIQRLDPRLHAFVAVFPERALAEARAADLDAAAGRWRGALHGVPLGVKDLLDIEGEPTRAGMDAPDEVPAAADSEVVRRLREAGAVILGKLAMTEAATLAHHPNLPRPENPWTPQAWSGVSSSGSGVAVAAGLCCAAIGTDTGGSIRMPSSVTGLTGLKPTWGRVSRRGLRPLCPSFDHIGPMARSAADAAVVLQAIAGPDPCDPTSAPEPAPDLLAELQRPVAGLRVGLDARALEAAHPDVAAAVRETAAALRSDGVEVREIRLPELDELRAMAMPAMMSEVAASWADASASQQQRFGPRFSALLDAARAVSGAEASLGYQARDRLTGELRRVLREVDALLLPTLPFPAPTNAEYEAMLDDPERLETRVLRHMSAFNLAGLPALSMPGAATREGLPVGVQLVADRLQEATVLRLAHAFQRVTNFHLARPQDASVAH